MEFAFSRAALFALLLICPAGLIMAEHQGRLLPPSMAGKKFEPITDGQNNEAGTLIVGGVEATKGRFPYMVNLNDPFGNGDNYCGGSLIAPNVVLSAAHCAGATEVTIGRFDLSSDPSNSYDRINVAEEAIHPNYDDWTMENDIMLLRLSRASDKPTITINYSGSSDVDQMLTVMGWGLMQDGGNAPDKLRYVDVPYITNSKCQNMYGEAIPDDMMCAGYDQGGKDACQGDSGGPLIISGGEYTQDMQVGVVSWGYGCAAAGYPGVYSRISESWTDFLRSKLSSWNVDITSPPSSPSPSPIPSPSPSPSPNPGPVPTPSPDPANCFECVNNPLYLFKDRPNKDCDWIAKRPNRRCRKGVNVKNCPLACGVCGVA